MIYSSGGQTLQRPQVPFTTDALRQMATPTKPFLCPELVFRGIPPTLSFEDFRSTNELLLGANVPYWAVAWPGGQALARWMLDQPDEVKGRTVVDMACGAGLAAVAAKRAGAKCAIAIDTDPNALIAARETALLNDVSIETRCGDLRDFTPETRTILCAGDLWYERELARLATTQLRQLAGAGHRVICADPGRPGRPRNNCNKIADYQIDVAENFEINSTVRCEVFELMEAPILDSHAPHDHDAPCGHAC